MKSTHTVCVVMLMLVEVGLAAGCDRDQVPASTSAEYRTDRPAFAVA